MRCFSLLIVVGSLGCSFEGATSDPPDPQSGPDASIPDERPDDSVGPFSAAAPLEGFAVEGCQFDDPWLSADELSIVVSSSCNELDVPTPNSGLGRDLYIARRQTKEEPFGPRVLLFTTLDSDQYGRLSANGETLHVTILNSLENAQLYSTSERTAGGLFINPTALLTSAAAARQESATLSSNGLELIFAADDGSGFDLIRATRDSPGDAWGDQIPISEINSPGHDYGVQLSGDRLLTFSSVHQSAAGPVGRSFYSTRADIDSPFSPPAMIEGLDAGADEIDPWLSPDRQTIYFVSRTVDVPQRRSIFVARRRQ